MSRRHDDRAVRDWETRHHAEIPPPGERWGEAGLLPPEESFRAFLASGVAMSGPPPPPPPPPPPCMRLCGEGEGLGDNPPLLFCVVAESSLPPAAEAAAAAAAIPRSNTSPRPAGRSRNPPALCHTDVVRPAVLYIRCGALHPTNPLMRDTAA